MGMMGAFNLQFSVQIHQKDNNALEPDMLIFPKYVKHLKKYLEQQQHAGRVRENTIFNAALSSLAAPPLPSTNGQIGTQLTLKETVQMHKQKAIAAATSAVDVASTSVEPTPPVVPPGEL
jgi:hypothetical protein